MAPCPYSCLENPMDREAWQAAVHSIAELSWTRLSPLALIFNLSSFFFVVCSQHACVHTHIRTHTLHHCLASLAGEKHWGSLPVSVRNLIMAADSCAMTKVCASGARPLQRGAVSHSALKRHSFPVVISLPTDHHVHSSVGLYALYKPAIHSLKPPS